MRSSPKRAVGAAVAVIGLILSVLAIASAPAGASTQDLNPEPYTGNPTCASFGYANGVKIEGQPEAKTYTFGATTIAISNVEKVGGRLEFDWASNTAWSAVMVKQANGGLIYEYPTAITSDQNVQTVSGKNSGGISHVNFCSGPSTQPTTGSLSIKKLVNGTGTPPAGDFSFTVDCSDNGQTVDADTQNAGDQAQFDLAAGSTKTLSGIPTGASCTVIETGAQGANVTSLSVDGDDPIDGTTVTGVIIGNGTTVNVVATNTFNKPAARTGSLSIDKVVTGNDQPAAGTAFSFSVGCLVGGQVVDLNDAAAGTDATFTLTAGQAAFVIDDVPAGATCTVSETNSQGADSTSWTVNGGAATTGSSVSNVAVGADTTVSVVATNAFNTTGGCVPDPTNNQCNTCPPGTTPNGQGGCTPPPPPPPPVVTNPALSASAKCAAGGQLVTVTNTGDGPGSAVVSNNGTVIDTVTVPAGQARTVLVPLEEDDAYAITVSGVTGSITGTQDCIDVGGIVIPKPVVKPVVTPVVKPTVITPVARPATQVLGNVITRPRTLARTGSDTLPLLEVGLGLLILGAGLTLSSRKDQAKA